MNILILGATGFIGSAVAIKLLENGHSVTGLGRNLGAARRRLPDLSWIDGDLRHYRSSAEWQKLLDGTDTVVNCAGTLQDSARDDVRAVQQDAMLALFQAARDHPAIRIVQVSASPGLNQSGTQFIETKLAADSALKDSGLDHVILRPALVLGRNAHGGSALLRALAAFPFVTPLAFPDSPVQVASLETVAKSVVDAVERKLPNGTDLELAGPPARLAALVAEHRKWLGLPPVPVLPVPPMLAKGLSKLADLAGWLGWRSPLRSTAMEISSSGITSSSGNAFLSDAVLPPVMTSSPAGAQDLWFARLYLLKPLIILTLSAFWIISGLVPLLKPERAALGFSGSFPPGTAMLLTLTSSLADIALGILVLFRARARKALLGMIALSLIYLFAGTMIQPSLWADPLGPLVKVFPSILLTLVALAIFEER